MQIGRPTPWIDGYLRQLSIAKKSECPTIQFRNICNITGDCAFPLYAISRAIVLSRCMQYHRLLCFPVVCNITVDCALPLYAISRAIVISRCMQYHGQLCFPVVCNITGNCAFPLYLVWWEIVSLSGRSRRTEFSHFVGARWRMYY